LKEETLTFTVKTDDTGHLFKKLRAEDIVTLLNDEQGIEIDTGAIELEDPINEVGEYYIAIDLFGEKTTIKVEVVSE
jgi:ribosomal protein L9